MPNTRPAEAQKTATRELADASRSTLERKEDAYPDTGRRVLSAHGLDTPRQAEGDMRSALRGGEGWWRFLRGIWARETRK